MVGAIIGDICGSPYEFIEYEVPYNFPLFVRGCTPTDDTVMTIAVADALNNCDIQDEKQFKKTLVDSMVGYGRKYRDAGYGGKFFEWIWSSAHEPYNSFGNGSAMRVSPVGWIFDDLDTTRRVARWTAEVTHNHPEGIKAAECVAAVIFMARNNADMNQITEYVCGEFRYSIHDIPSGNHVSCQTTMPICLKALYQSHGFEDAIRTAISYGHDTDTYGAITGSMAEAYYGIDKRLMANALSYLPDEFIDVLDKFLKIRKAPKDGFYDI